MTDSDSDYKSKLIRILTTYQKLLTDESLITHTVELAEFLAFCQKIIFQIYISKNFNIKLQTKFTTWIALLLPLIDVFTDHVFGFLNAIKINSPAVAAIGVASLINLAFGPMIYGEENYLP